MIRPGIFKKFLIAALFLALVPLLAATLFLFPGLEQVRDHLSFEIGSISEQQATEGLQMRARQVAQNLSDYLHHREADLLFLAGFAENRQVLLDFWHQKRNEVWEQRAIAPGMFRESREMVPLYRSFALIDRFGNELLVLHDGKFLTKDQLHNVAKPAETEFRCETYFNEIKKLKKGEIHVTRLTGFHVNKQQQLAGADEPEYAMGERYKGVIRFGTPLFDHKGAFKGAFVISLDHRHLMEFTQHIDPGPGFSTPFPSYKSGNYAFLFDDEGWIITHPKLWDIRGVDRQGKLLPPYRKESSAADIEAGNIPYNLDHADFIHPNYPVASKAVREQKSGTVELTNVGGARKIMAYAPILYNTGLYDKYGVFGGVTIGYQVDQFQKQASTSSRLITNKLQEYKVRSALFVSLAALLAAVAAWRMARSITNPLQELIEKARLLASGESGSQVIVRGNDELAELAQAFNSMTTELEQRKENLVTTLEKLKESRRVILDERNFKEGVLESISSAITTFAPDGTLTSRNSTADHFIGRQLKTGNHYSTVFEGMEQIPARIGKVLTEGTGYGREPLKLQKGGSRYYLDFGIFPIGQGAEQGLTVTLRDETVREKLREETVRLDRLASLGKLAAGISHEIRNPLTGVSLLLDDLHDRAALNTEDRQMLGRALAEIERVERLVASLLSFAAPPQTEPKMGKLDETVQEVALLLKHPCQRKGVILQLDCKPLQSFMFDHDKIRQAVLNLIKNAQEAMPEGGTLQVVLNQENNLAVLKVKDSGPGIQESDLPLLFEPFFTRKGAGTGLGLSITNRIIEEHGGSITAENLEGGGACFIVSLPMQR